MYYVIGGASSINVRPVFPVTGRKNRKSETCCVIVPFLAVEEAASFSRRHFNLTFNMPDYLGDSQRKTKEPEKDDAPIRCNPNNI